MTAAPDALSVAYTELAQFSLALDEQSSWLPTGCAGWSVRDLIFHLLGDAQRALVALAIPATPAGLACGPTDRDKVTYWRDFTAVEDPDSRTLRAVRTMASAWRLDNLTAAYAETARAVVAVAGRAGPTELVSTQGHVLIVADLLDTLVVEATLHHLDLVVELDRPGPSSVPLAATRATVDALLGTATPIEWDDASWLRAATGRRPLTEDERAVLGAAADRLPVLA